MQSIVTNVNFSLIELEKKQESLVDGYNHLIHEVQAEKAEIGILKFKTEIAKRIALLNLILTQYGYETSTLVSIVNTALQGSIHSSLLDTKILKHQIKEIKTQLPKGLNIPSVLNAGISEFLRLASINVVYIQDILVFNLEIPLVSNYDFVLYKLIPLPFKLHNNISVIIEPSSDYIAVDKARLYYIELSNQQLTKCKIITDTRICYHDQPIHYVKESCEMMLFRQPKVLPETCNLRYIKFTISIWHRLEDTNSWLYVIDKGNIIIKCENISDPEILDINGTGIFQLNNQCEANTNDNTILIPKRKIISKIYTDFVPQLNLSFNFLTQFESMETESQLDITLLKENPKIKNNLNNLIENSKSLKELHKQLKGKLVEETLNIPRTYMYVIITVLVIGVSIFIIIVYFKLKNIFCKKLTQVHKVYDEIDLKNINAEIPGKSLPRVV
jgi:hypothetical protein